MKTEFDISQDLIDLRSALQKRVVLGDRLGTTPTVEDDMLRDIYGQSTKIGKTDSFISNQEREEINGEIEKIRSWVITYGEREEEDGREIYVSTAERVNVVADGYQLEDIDHYLFLYTKDEQNGSAELVLEVDFQKKYRLEIEFESFESKPSEHQLSDWIDFTINPTVLDFKQPTKHPYMYLSGRHNLEDMDSREFRIISFYLDQFMRVKQIE